MGKASETLSIASPDGYTFTMWVNPDGFGMEGKALYVGFENNTVANGKITLGNRTTGNGLSDGTGFIISVANLEVAGNRYLPSMTGEDVGKAVAAETEFKKIIASMKFN
jgi:hypothetical protein